MSQNWKITLITGIVICSFGDKVMAQSAYLPDQTSRHALIGVTAGDFSGDLALGVELSFRPLFRNPVCIKLKGNVNWMEQYKVAYDRWSTYSTVSASAVIYRKVNRRARAYMEVGPFFIIPSNKISYRSFVAGISGLGGLELFLAHAERTNTCYFFGLGIAYSRARAEVMNGNPQYGSGVVFSNGVRFYL